MAKPYAPNLNVPSGQQTVAPGGLRDDSGSPWGDLRRFLGFRPESQANAYTFEPHSSTLQYLHDFAHSLDPHTREGLVNWAALFVPGPGRGGRFVGKLTPVQEHYMKTLGNITTGAPPGWLLDRLEQEGMDTSKLSTRRLYGWKGPQGSPAPPLSAGRAPQSFGEMSDLFGRGSQDPLVSLMLSQMPKRGSTPAREHVANQKPVAEQKLGLGKDELPNWTYPKHLHDIFRPEGDLSNRQTVRGMHEEMSDDQRIQLALIIATILRRSGEQGGIQGKLGEPGSN